MKVKATWKPIGLNPFAPNFEQQNRRTIQIVEFGDDVPWEEVEQQARDVTPPDGYEFEKVEKIEE